MKIVIDKNIPYIKGIFEKHFDVLYLSAKEIDASAVRDADALIVRTRTRCDAALLEGSTVKFIASATAGYDHIDAEYCNRRSIEWRNAAGCNADSVCQYVMSAVAVWSEMFGVKNFGKYTIGVVGVGNVGRKIIAFAEMVGMKVLAYDPFVENLPYTATMEEIQANADIITFHTPLTFDGEHPTYHLADERFFESLRRQPMIINAARGGVVDEDALKDAILHKRVGFTVLDCWCDEPDADVDLMDMVNVSTPHIAGYSADGKQNATVAVIEAVSDFFSIDVDMLHDALSDKEIVECGMDDVMTEFLSSYNIMSDSDELKKEPVRFEEFRAHYHRRRERTIIINH